MVQLVRGSCRGEGGGERETERDSWIMSQIDDPISIFLWKPLSKHPRWAVKNLAPKTRLPGSEPCLCSLLAMWLCEFEHYLTSLQLTSVSQSEVPLIPKASIQGVPTPILNTHPYVDFLTCSNIYTASHLSIKEGILSKDSATKGQNWGTCK